MNGLLIIDKPAGITSHDVVARCRKILKTKRIGHTGTLDPFATGVMVILVGQATRLAQFLDKAKKEYLATVRFGFETDTGDLTGLRKADLEGENPKSEIRIPQSEIEAVLKEFRGEIKQIPPMYSAKKIEGKKLYELARKGIEVERQPVSVTIYELVVGDRWSGNSGQGSVVGGQKEEITDPQQITDPPQITDHRPPTTDHCLRVLCSAGTYIRTLAEDIGRKIGGGAHLAALRRTRAGEFDLSRAVTLEELEKYVSDDRLADVLISMNEALGHLPEIRLSADEARKTRNGMSLHFNSTEPKDNQPFRLIDENGDLIAVGVYSREKNIIRPRIVLV